LHHNVADIELRVLGGFEARIRRTGAPIHLPTRKCEALLTYVALAPGRLIRRDSLVALLWGDVPRAQGRHSLRQTLTKLRGGLAPSGPAVLVTISDAIRFAEECVWVDALELERLLLDSGSGATQEAIDLYRGPLLDGFAIPENGFEEWLVHERARLRQVLIDACAARLALLEDSNDLSAGIRVAIKLLELEPLHEAVHRRLMVLYGRNGQIRSALDQYELCAHRLKRAFGAEPSAATTTLYREWLLKYNRIDPPPDPLARRDGRDITPS
jgi:DNA-binding SARP family transcriptional activator